MKSYGGWKEAGVARLREFREIGQTFNYLGRTCVVTAHESARPGLGHVPQLNADYADDHGVIHGITFSVDELPGLLAQNDNQGRGQH